jgi:hypothetical protein
MTGEGTRRPNPGPRGQCSVHAGANRGALDGTVKRRQRSATGGATGSRSAPLYRGSRGTRPRGAGGGKGAPESWGCRRERRWVQRDPRTSQPNNDM